MSAVEFSPVLLMLNNQKRPAPKTRTLELQR
jgi:hypothetical protein